MIRSGTITSMSDMTSDPHSSDAMVGPHGAGDHGGDHGHDDHGHDDHGHDDHAHGDGDTLGPVNTAAWGAGLIGIIGGLLVALVLAMAAGWLG